MYVRYTDIINITCLKASVSSPDQKLYGDRIVWCYKLSHERM